MLCQKLWAVVLFLVNALRSRYNNDIIVQSNVEKVTWNEFYDVYYLVL